MAARPLAPNHALVFDALKEAGRPVTAYELIDAVRDVGISAPPTVYRALNRLIADGRAHKIESTNTFVACTHAHPGDCVPVFVICDVCGEASEFDDATVGAQLAKRAAERTFTVGRTVVELHGTCAKCAAEAAAAG
mgnify:CR=1 FL=1